MMFYTPIYRIYAPLPPDPAAASCVDTHSGTMRDKRAFSIFCLPETAQHAKKTITYALESRVLLFRRLLPCRRYAMFEQQETNRCCRHARMIVIQRSGARQQRMLPRGDDTLLCVRHRRLKTACRYCRGGGMFVAPG